MIFSKRELAAIFLWAIVARVLYCVLLLGFGVSVGVGIVIGCSWSFIDTNTFQSPADVAQNYIDDLEEKITFPPGDGAVIEHFMATAGDSGRKIIDITPKKVI